MPKLLGIFFVVFSLLFFTAIGDSKAQQEDAYMISGVTVSASAKSAGDAKVVATNNARREAFTTLLSRLALSASITNNVTNDEIFDMVRSEQIAEEKIAGSNYSATFNILFARSAVDRVLKDKGSKSAEVIEDNYLIIPVKIMRQKGKADIQKFSLWEDSNEWKSAIEKATKSRGLNKFIIPENDISNVSILNQDNVDKLEYTQIEPLFARYKSVGVYLVFFYFDDIENKVSISVKNIRKLQKKQVKLSFVNTNRLSYDALINKVADKTIEYLVTSQSDNSAKMANKVRFEVKINSFGNWMMMKNKIEGSNLISQMNIEAISKDYVTVSVDYIGSDPDVVAAFAKAGLSLSKKSDNFYIVSLPVMENLKSNLNSSGQ